LVTRLHDWFLATWYGVPRRGAWLLPAAWLFGGVAALRRALYAWGWLGRYRSRRPVVIVGNVTVGGTGKTPLVAWLARELTRRGLVVGVALRGYGGQDGPARLVSRADSAVTVGDEALLLSRKLAGPVAIARRRADAVRHLEDACNVIVCDDGLQHYALVRDVEIAVVDATRGFGNGRLLPAGPLREPVSRLDSVDAVVLNGEGFDWPSSIRMQIEPVAIVSLRDGSRRPLSDYAGRDVVAVAAIGNPERFFALLRQCGLRVQSRVLPDHAHFSPAEAGAIPGLPLLMTEKDAVKCTGDGWGDAGYLEVQGRIDEMAAASLLGRIVSLASESKERPLE
jgi:tetraacyldisaccharide 4'-kinase